METIARGDVPKTLQTIAYISIPKSADLEFLLWDLQTILNVFFPFLSFFVPVPLTVAYLFTGEAAIFMLPTEAATLTVYVVVLFIANVGESLALPTLSDFR